MDRIIVAATIGTVLVFVMGIMAGIALMVAAAIRRDDKPGGR